MNALIIGGPRHGEWVDVLDGVAGWVDIRHAATHRIRRLNWGITAPGDGGMQLTGEQYRVALAVHPDLTGDPMQEQSIVTQLIQMMAMNEFIRAHGEFVPPEPAPPTPAALFGPDGSPL